MSSGLGGPADSTLFYVFYIYNKAFREFEMGYACALAWILFVIVLLITLVQFKYIGKRVYYEFGETK
jgi:multiple sugar transport system permease protein